MQKDMHYYATYAIAKAAGIEDGHCAIIAFASQFVDDSHASNNESHSDKGLFFGITSTYGLCNEIEQRRAWIPFHFFPGGKGETLQEKIICVRDSTLVQKMFMNHIGQSNKNFILELIGIASHVYMDTFSHYSFSGMESTYNAVEDIEQKESFNYLFNEIRGKILGNLSGQLGHSGADVLPDLPYLQWEITFKENRPSKGKVSIRNNPKYFLEGCKRLYEYLCIFANTYYAELPVKRINFKEIEKEVIRLISIDDKDEEKRCQNWHESLAKGAPPYAAKDWVKDWQNEKYFSELDTSPQSINTPVYRFHQAAAYHRYYVLKDLFPEHGITVKGETVVF